MAFNPKKLKYTSIICYAITIGLVAIYVYDKIEDNHKLVEFPFIELAALSLCTAILCRYLSKLNR